MKSSQLHVNSVDRHLEKYLDSEVRDVILTAYQQPHRYFHTLVHISEMLDAIENDTLTWQDRKSLTLAIAFHDIVYDPTRTDNEEKSSEVAKQYINDSFIYQRVEHLILGSKTHWGNVGILGRFNELDTRILKSREWPELLQYENDIAKEYQVHYIEDYRRERSNVLTQFAKSYNNSWLTQLADHVLYTTKNVAIFAGSFNPFHLGHLDVLHQAEEVFDKVVLAVGINPSKVTNNPYGEDRVANLKEILPFHEIRHFDGLLTDLIQSYGGHNTNVTLVRGLRNGGDLDIELRTLRFMRDIMPTLKVAYIPCRPEHEHISSSAVRELQKLGTPKYLDYLPKKYVCGLL